LKKNG
jgi:hypothetical protein